MNSACRRVPRLTIAGMLVVGLAGVGATNAATKSGGPKKISVTFTVTPISLPDPTPEFTVDYSRCDPPDENPSTPCVTVGKWVPGFDQTVAGDVQGLWKQGTGAQMAVRTPLNRYFVVMQKVDAAIVKGCGSGTFVVQREGNRSLNGGVWKVVTNSGSGALEKMSGAGTFVDAYTSTYKGQFTCG